MTAPPATDIVARDEGTIWLLFGNTPGGQVWLDTHLQDGPTLGSSRAVEHRFVEDILLGAQNDGLIVALQ
jgi:hypothetical protein